METKKRSNYLKEKRRIVYYCFQKIPFYLLSFIFLNIIMNNSIYLANCLSQIMLTFRGNLAITFCPKILHMNL